MVISISGKINSGKDIVGRVIQTLLAYPELDNILIQEYLDTYPENEWFLYDKTNWDIKKWADKLKEIVASLLGCTVDQLEDEEFKNTPLSKEWWYYDFNPNGPPVKLPYTDVAVHDQHNEKYLVKLTPRIFMQILGTQAGRELLHPNIWVNALMRDYRGTIIKEKSKGNMSLHVLPKREYPKWIITDTRFRNELRATQDLRGFNIRVRRICDSCNTLDGHTEDCQAVKDNPTLIDESELQLDSYLGWDHTIDNVSTLSNLIDQVRGILIKEKLI